MTMKTKSFKIGERAIGGIIKLEMLVDNIRVMAINEVTKNIVESKSFIVSETTKTDLFLYIDSLTNYYKASFKIMDFVDKQYLVFKKEH